MTRNKETLTPSPPPALDLQGIKEGARRTGFDLEYRVATQLRAAGWKVITSKYYLDDHSEQAREIDIVAYRETELQNFTCCTMLIVSCKKHESNAWVMMARPVEQGSPDSDWQPFHGWTSNKPLSYFMGQKGFGTEYHDKATAAGALKALELPRVDVFAFQEMSLTGKLMNDKNIFESFTGLMKAQAHELASLPDRKKGVQVVYQFNLISVVDAPLVCLEYGGLEPVATEVDHEHHVARYIVKKKDVFSRIRIVRASSFGSVLEEYGALHDANIRTFQQMHDDFYVDAALDHVKLNLLKDDFVKELRRLLTYQIRQRVGLGVLREKQVDFVATSSDPPCTTIGLELKESEVSAIGADQAAMNAFRIALKKVYRYEGDFELEATPLY